MKAYFSPTDPLFVPVDFVNDHKAVTRSRLTWPPSVLWILPDIRHLRLYYGLVICLIVKIWCTMKGEKCSTLFNC